MLSKKTAVLLDLLVFLNTAEQRLLTSYCSNHYKNYLKLILTSRYWWGG